ncbi:MAG TPA: nickel-dependent lactate racemase, partial [Dehalococcoidales bacterium]|nr:nickel-dependent lactate racemase [Dehalococcoidales bacterium]
MAVIKIPYGREQLSLEIEPEQLKAVLEPESKAPEVKRTEQDIVRQALAEPIASPQLSEIASKAHRVLLITSDHTRPMPSKITLPILLDEIRSQNPDVQVKILVATGFHRLTKPDELIARFGQKLCDKEEIIVHDSRDKKHLVFKGKLPSGGELWLNDLVDWADLIVAEGFIEPHFFAGFSGGRKSILPGIAGTATVLANHCAAFIASENARTGNLQDNPIHKDMLFAAEKVGLAFILNVALDANKKIIRA